VTVVLPRLGAPGVYLAPDLVAAAPLGVRMDACAFVGVAPRGPAWERSADRGFDADGLLAAGRARSVPVAVESWAEYVEIFGGFEGPGLLPYTVAAFFAQGGRRAYVQRVVPARPRPSPEASAATPGRTVDLPRAEPPGCAVLAFDPAALAGAAADSLDLAAAADPVRLRARNEGSWGDRLSATLSFAATAIPRPSVGSGATLLVADGATVAAGDLLRLLHQDGTVELRTVLRTATIAGRPTAYLDGIVLGPLARAELVTCTLDVYDADPSHPRQERFADAGLRSAHPRWLGALLADSRLVELATVRDAGGATQELQAITPRDTALPPVAAQRPADGSGDGVDRYPLITVDDVLGPLQVVSRDSEPAPDGLDALTALLEPGGYAAPASLVVPDLYAPYEARDVSDVGVPATAAGAGFDVCVPMPAVPAAPVAPGALRGLRLDPGVPADRAQIIARQQRLVDAAEALGVVALLDVPPGLRPAQVFAWRAAFDSCWAAAWHGWLRTPAGDGLVTVPPTGNAAGLIAATELVRGPATGPALTTLAGVVAVADGPGSGVGPVDAGTLNALHRAGLNVALPERDGVVFTAARTLALDQQWRQLTVRRVVTLIERSVASGLGWATFEPNDTTLRTRVAVAIDALLRDLFYAGAFAGGTTAESYFVRTSPPGTVAGLGEADLLCEIGVAPSEPLEFLLVRVLRADDGTLTTQEGT
jgi:hypothetical protein